MKNTLMLLIALIIILPLQAQDITNKLGGDTDAVKYDVTDSADNVLLRIQGDGKVGVGTDTPSEVLDVDGNIAVSGTVDGIDIATDVTANTAKISATTYSIGDFAQGGIVFWVDETKQHGLVCSKRDQAWYTLWNDGPYGNTHAKGDGPFSGEANTIIIIAATLVYGDYDNAYAARICNELQITEGDKTYGDWYLPSKKELNLMYTNKATINATATANSGTTFGSFSYWSSTEYSNFCAWWQSFGSGSQVYMDKAEFGSVRSVRAF